MAMTAISKIQKQATQIKNGNHRITPGEPHCISEAASIGDGVWQGDLGIEIVDSIPVGYTKVQRPKEPDCQLVPGNTQGARHCLDSLDGVELFRPTGWGDSYEGLDGPVLRLTKERTVTHPKHGDVTIPSGFTVRCRYQREYDAEQRRVRRNAD